MNPTIIVVAGAVAMLTTAVATPLSIRLLLRQKMLDHPNNRSSHTLPTPRGGGIACALGLLTGGIISAAAGQPPAWSTLFAAILMGIVGLADDRFNLPAAPRLASQITIGMALGAAIGGPVWAAIGAILMPTLVNIVNFTDGINGLIAATMALWGVSTAAVGLTSAIPELATLGSITAGAALGFLPWKAPRAHIFLGDVGSYLFGMIAAGGITYIAAQGAPTPAIIAPIALLIADATLTLGRRIARRDNILEPHRLHTYQQIVDILGVSHIAATSWILTLSTTLTIMWHTGHSWQRLVATLVLILIYLCTPRLGLLRRNHTDGANATRHRAPQPDSENNGT